MKRFAFSIAMLCSTAAMALDVALPGGRVTHFSDPPTEQDLSRAATTAANLMLYDELCERLPPVSWLFVANLITVAGRARVEVFVSTASHFVARNGTPAYCVMVRSQLPREVFE